MPGCSCADFAQCWVRSDRTAAFFRILLQLQPLCPLLRHLQSQASRRASSPDYAVERTSLPGLLPFGMGEGEEYLRRNRIPSVTPNRAKLRLPLPFQKRARAGERILQTSLRFEPRNRTQVGRVTPCAPSSSKSLSFHIRGAQRTARPTWQVMGREFFNCLVTAEARLE